MVNDDKKKKMALHGMPACLHAPPPPPPPPPNTQTHAHARAHTHTHTHTHTYTSINACAHRESHTLTYIWDGSSETVFPPLTVKTSNCIPGMSVKNKQKEIKLLIKKSLFSSSSSGPSQQGGGGGERKRKRVIANYIYKTVIVRVLTLYRSRAYPGAILWHASGQAGPRNSREVELLSFLFPVHVWTY